MTTSFDMDDLTLGEKKAIKQIDKAMAVLGERHWFFMSADGLKMMRYGDDGDRVLDHRSVDQNYIAASISGHDTDGGDW